MLEVTQHQIVTEPSAFMSAIIWLYLFLSPADSEIDARTSDDQTYEFDKYSMLSSDRMEDKF